MGGDSAPTHTSGLTLAPDIQNARTHFLKKLAQEGFEGDITPDIAARLVGATDNSIYQTLPALVIYPKTPEDLNRTVRAAQDGTLTLAMRGGGTGTNGQSLTSGIVVDVARHLDQILSFDAEAETVTLQPGVVLARLNAFLKPHGFFFPPTVSTATRATLGGMIATDASGKGSRIYGRTSDYIETMDIVLSDGTDLPIHTLSPQDLADFSSQNSLPARIYREVSRVVTQHADEIARVFPDMNRGLTGYNLQNILSPNGTLNIARLLAGSEGTLALTKQVTLRVKRLPRFRQLLVVRYESFDSTLRDVQTLLPANPAAVEVLDDRVLEKATQDIVWNSLETVLCTRSERPVKGMSFVEFVGDDLKLLEAQKQKALTLLENSPFNPIDYKAISDPETITQLWTLREKSVGLLGRPDGTKQGVAFVEDTAVPPEKLADYVTEFRAILDEHALSYGMFGHADVGCLHVRPFLDMTTAHDRALIRPISDAVASLTKKHGGLLWGEHGRGYRGEFSPLFFGETLFAELCNIKKVFDPLDIFNRGKLASATVQHPIDQIDAIPFKGTFDEQISPSLREDLGLAISCNGNGACYNREPDMAMCPSYKSTKDRLQSPKGRATLLRSWARLTSLPTSAPDRQALPDLTQRLKTSLETCLSCKACATQCPIRVDIPTMKSRFLNHYYRTNRRPFRDYAVYWLEPLLSLGRTMPGLANLLLNQTITRNLLKTLGFVDLPKLHPTSLPRHQQISPKWLKRADSKSIVLIQDSFTGSFDGPVIDAAHNALTTLGYDVRLTPVWNNGKARHVRGFHAGFLKAARKTLAQLHQITRQNIPVIALDAATGLMFEQEYKSLEGQGSHQTVMSLENFLKHQIDQNVLPAKSSDNRPESTVISHCTEQATRPGSAEDWATILTHFGLPTKAGKAGCCGMAGLFGHEAENADLSEKIFQQNWAGKLTPQTLATGFSCRCQTKRMANRRAPHPIETLSAWLQGSIPSS